MRREILVQNVFGKVERKGISMKQEARLRARVKSFEAMFEVSKVHIKNWLFN